MLYIRWLYLTEDTTSDTNNYIDHSQQRVPNPLYCLSLPPFFKFCQIPPTTHPLTHTDKHTHTHTHTPNSPVLFAFVALFL